jgi:hypothetical protein
MFFGNFMDALLLYFKNPSTISFAMSFSRNVCKTDIIVSETYATRERLCILGGIRNKKKKNGFAKTF